MYDDRIDRNDLGGDDSQDLPPDMQAIYQRIREDGAAWRTSPDLARVGERLRESARQLALQQSPVQRDTDPERPRATRGDILMPHTQPHTQPHTRSRPQRTQHDTYPPSRRDAPENDRWRAFKRRVGGAVAATAALAIVGAVAALFLSVAPGHPSGTPNGAGSSAQHGHWVTLDELAANVEFDANDLPAVAPSDPRVVYESLVYGIQQGKAGTLRRSDDGGATWNNLPLPVPAAHVGHAGFLVSPLDAHIVFLTLVDTNGADCPAGTTQPLTEGNPGAVICWIPYTSTDGGNHWKQTKLPAPGSLTPNITNNNATSLATALGPDGKARLYAVLECAGAETCTRLVASADGGVSWQYADAQLMAAGVKNVCASSADPRSTGVYAVTSASADCGWQAQQPLTLWRSDDAGAHWKQLGQLATPNIRGLQVAHPLGGSALIYAVEPRTTQMSTDKMGGKYPLFSADPADVKGSTDGGAAWTNAPSAGITSGLKPYFDVGALGTLSDGSIVIECVSASAEDNFSGGTLFAWKPGDKAWRQLAPPLSWEAGALTVIPSTGGVTGNDTLYLVMVDRDGGSPAKAHPTFSFLRYEP